MKNIKLLQTFKIFSSHGLTRKLLHLGRGGEEPSASSGFFWPIEGFFGGVLVLIPTGEVTDGIREPSWKNKRKFANDKNDNKWCAYRFQSMNITGTEIK